MGVIVAIVPVITYVFGRKEGAHAQQVQHLEDSAAAEKDKAEFHSSMGDVVHEAQANRPIDRDSVVERLRKHGL